MGTINTRLPSPADAPRNSAFSDLNISAGSVTDEQRIDWLLRECEMRLLDDNGAPYGQDLTSRSEIDTAIQSQNH